jgi:hypothetical protein
MLETLLGGLVGGVLRLAPEVLSFLDKKNERKHELALGDQQYRVAELQLTSQLNVKELDVEQSQFVSAFEALKEGVKSQGTPTGIKWVDALSASVRPGITAWIFTLYSAVKLAALYLALKSGEGAMALLSIWGSEDTSMLSAVVMFWFVGRVWKSQATPSNL